MFNKLKKFMVRKEKVHKTTAVDGKYAGIAMGKSLGENIKLLKKIFKDCDDFIFRSFKIAGRVEAQLVFIEGMIKLDTVDDSIVKPLMLESRMAGVKIEDGKSAFRYAKDTIIATSNLKETKELEEVLFSIMTGAVVIIIDGNESAFVADVKGYEHRAVEQPASESTVRGPRDSFTETIRVNTALVRRRIRDPRLKLKTYHLGRRSKTELVIMYIEDIVNPNLVDEVYKRLDGVDVDNVAGSGFIEQIIEDDWISPFPQVRTTERPDKVAAAMLEGKVCIIVDNTSYALILPATMNDLLTAPDDYYERWMIATLIRTVRLIGAIASTILPAFYIAMVSYHPEMIPTALAISIAGGREGIPFPAFIEAFLMEASFELMREAGVRLPTILAQAVGVVGGVVIGQAAVAAGVVSPAMVVVVALTGIANFSVPSFDVALSFRILRFGLMMLSAALGLYGIILGLLFILSHLCILKSFGTPYMAPWIPMTLRDLKDTILRAPWISMRRRPSFMGIQDEKRMNMDGNEEILHRRKNRK
jgi:spore germination protein